MRCQSSSVLAVATASLLGLAAAVSNSPVAPIRRQTTCPSVWTDVATDLKSSFVASNGTCTADARAAIRLSFHDCFPGSCDGSIILANECTDRGENTQLVDICTTIGDKATQYNVSTADMIQFATAIGIASCPGGPTISFKAGRIDNTTANPSGQMPNPTDNATVLIAAFAAKGFTATELVALVGAHSTAKNLADQPLDSTPGQWDTKFYTETADGTVAASLDSDRYLSNSSETSSTWNSFSGSASSWQDAFVPAMEKMSLLGNDESSLVDCSSVITDAFATSDTDSDSVAKAKSGSDSTSASASSTPTSSSASIRVGEEMTSASLALVLLIAFALTWN